MSDRSLSPARVSLIDRALSGIVRTIAHAILRWEPAGSVLVRLPSGEEVRFGRADGSGEPVLVVNRLSGVTRALRRGAMGFAEAYMAGDIECTDLTALMRFFMRNESRFKASRLGLFRHPRDVRHAHRARANTLTGSRRNIMEHYDLGNDFFQAWLDDALIYSSAYYASPGLSLADAQAAKLDLVLDQLALEEGSRVLEIGCGWGALALRAAERFGADVTGITISPEQLAFAQGEARRRGLDGQAGFRLEDYRETRGRFDRVMSVEMIEAVGEAYWPVYFTTLSDRLVDGGIAAIQAITIDETRFESYRRKPDFIQRYIFPGGMLPTRTLIKEHAARAGLVLENAVHFGESYALTLRAWRRRFDESWPQIRRLGFDEAFARRWRYYLAYCETGFLEKAIDVGVYRLRKT